jgi:hypothetical protein
MGSLGSSVKRDLTVQEQSIKPLDWVVFPSRARHPSVWQMVLMAGILYLLTGCSATLGSWISFSGHGVNPQDGYTATSERAFWGLKVAF